MRKLKEKLKIFYLLPAVLSGKIALADTIPSSGSETLDDLVRRIIDTMNTLIYVLFALATVVFAWGIIEMLAGAGDPEKIETGKRHMIWGIIGLTIMFSAWGIVELISNYLSINGNSLF